MSQHHQRDAADGGAAAGTGGTGSAAPPGAPPGAAPVVTPVRVVIALCLAAPFVAMLWVGSYAKADPAFAGIPFFYWYQMLWVLVSTALTALAYRLWQRDQRVRRGGGAK